MVNKSRRSRARARFVEEDQLRKMHENLKPRIRAPVTKEEARIIIYCILGDLRKWGPGDARARKAAREHTGFSQRVVRNVHLSFQLHGEIRVPVRHRNYEEG
ncbi:unnamed protein product, partial [Ectocarpus sp. 8 AP-2014]